MLTIRAHTHPTPAIGALRALYHTTTTYGENIVLKAAHAPHTVAQQAEGGGVRATHLRAQLIESSGRAPIKTMLTSCALTHAILGM